MAQLGFSETEHAGKRKRTKREKRTGVSWFRKVAVCMVVSSLTGALACSARASAVDPAKTAGPGGASPIELVNPFIGTGATRDTNRLHVRARGNINTFPGAAVPFGMLSFSPASTTRPRGGDYSYYDDSLVGFSLTHFSGPGCQSAGDIPILPANGMVGSHPANATAPFAHAHESATPGSYAVTLWPSTPKAIDVRLTATTRTGMGVFRFPSQADSDFLFKVSDAQTTSPTATVQVVGNNAVVGSETSGRFCGSQGTTTVYFAARFDRPFQKFGVWGRDGKSGNQRVQTGSHVGGWVSFDTTRDRVVKLKVAISYVSVADAWANLSAEDSGWSFDAVEHRARQAWRDALGRIEVHGGTRDQKVQFYTALYHTLLHPNVFSDANGDYIGFDNKIHHVNKDQKVQYANFSGWDTYRSTIQLQTLLMPDRMNDMIKSLLNDQSQGGWLPKWGYDNLYTGVMGGDSADPIIADALAFGADDFDIGHALAAMVKGATDTSRQQAEMKTRYVERPHLEAYQKLGYVPVSPSETLEYALDDFSIAQVARRLGRTATYEKFLARSGYWRNVFDKNASFRGFKGYMAVRGLDGSFPAHGAVMDIPAGNTSQPGFEEGNAVQYTWLVPQDLHGLIAAMGGDDQAVSRLDIFFKRLNAGASEPFFWAGNEMCLGIPWVYDYAGAPWKTTQIVHRILQQAYANDPGGEPGNDDLGAMSAWLVWADLGMYPETPGAPVLVLSAPVFPEVTLHLKHHTVVISTPHAGLDGYIHSLQVNGKAWSRSWLPVDLLTQEGKSPRKIQLTFSIGNKANQQWGSSVQDRPPSYPAPKMDGKQHGG